MEWDTGYGTDAPDADKTDIVEVGLMVVGNEVEQVGEFYVDDIQIKDKPVNYSVDTFESYTADDQLITAWPFSKAGGPDGLAVSLNTANKPPQGKSCMAMDVNMPEKWWHNIVKKTLDGVIVSFSICRFGILVLWRCHSKSSKFRF